MFTGQVANYSLSKKKKKKNPSKFIWQHIPTLYVPSGFQKDSIAFNLPSPGEAGPLVSNGGLHEVAVC